MDGFGYLITLVSVVAGLGLTHALSGLAKLVHLRKQVLLSGVHIAWTASVVLWLVSYWWFTFLLAGIDQWTIPLLLFVLAYGAVVYFLIALLYPDHWDSGTDLFEYFLDNRRWFFGAFVGLGVLDIADTCIKVVVYDLPSPPIVPYSLLIVFWLTLGTIGAITPNRGYHITFACVWLIVFGSWIVATLFAI
jgi:hypothetical protein